jgi:hypothetical protein
MEHKVDVDFAPSPYAREGLALSDIFQAAKAGRATGFVTFGLTLLMALLLLAIVKPTYTAQILIAEKADSADLAPARSALNLIGGLSGTGGGAPSQFKLLGDVVTSNALAKVLDEKYGMVKVIYADQWDRHTHSWIKPSGLLASIKAGIKAILQMPAWTPPDYRDLATYLASNVHLISSAPALLGTASAYSLQYNNGDPHFAAYFLTAVFTEADALMRQRHEAELQKNVAYLQRRLAQTTEVGYREALTQIVADQEKQLMVLHGDTTYTAEIVDGAVSPKLPSFPNVKLTLVLTVIVGGFLALIASIAQGLFWPNWRPWSKLRRASHIPGIS